MPDFRLAAADAIVPAELHAAFTAAFADYLIGPFTLPLEHWPRFTARQGVDLSLSRVALGPAGILAFALVAPRGDCVSWRLGTMGAVPAARGTGAAQALLDDFIARAAAAGQSRVELECFAQNARGLRLYRSRAFAEVAPLHGYASEGAPVPAASAGLEDVPLEAAFAWLDAASRSRNGDLPLQVTTASLRAQPFALRAWRCGGAQVVGGETSASQLTLFSLVDESPAQRDAQALVASLVRQFAGHTFHVPQLQRADLGGDALQRLGWRRLPLHQLLMHRAL